jgi:glycosyltransferase involved in cell wall biosynthesis
MDEKDGASFLYGESHKTIAALIGDTKSHSGVQFLKPMSESEVEEFAKRVKSVSKVKIQPDSFETLESEQKKKKTQTLRSILMCGCTLWQRDQGDHNNFIAIPDDDYEWGDCDGYHIELVGSGRFPQELSEAIETRKFVPWSKRFEVFRNASAIVVPSRHEPFGMIVLEAMQAGIPVFVSRHAGVTDVANSPRRIDESDHMKTARQIVRVLRNCHAWRRQVEAQLKEVQKYAESHVEGGLMRMWETYVQATQSPSSDQTNQPQ